MQKSIGKLNNIKNKIIARDRTDTTTNKRLIRD